MKRLILLATMMVAVLASCEKHEIQNEVINEIGFTSNVGKLTKAIADGNKVTDYFKSQPFGVYAYSYQNGTYTADVMSNQEVAYQTEDGASSWKATGSTKYYWPNDSRTTLSFYAYSPFNGNGNGNGNADAKHQQLNGRIAHSITYTDNTKKEDGCTPVLTLSEYTHNNMYVDFMVSDPVTQQKYGTNANNKGTVNLTFRHKLTQLTFNVSCGVYPSVDFKILDIKLVNLTRQSTFTSNASTQWSTGSADTIAYVVYPAKLRVAAADGAAEINPNGADAIVNADANNDNEEDFVTVKNYGGQNTPVSLTTTPITVIPQTLNENSQYLRIRYEVSGTGVAKEEVIKYVYFNGVNNTATPSTAIVWAPNKKITYNLVIGLNEIKFNPTIEDWSPETSENVPVLQ